MPFVSVKCPSCGGDIQLDDSRESGFCVYCGAKVMYKEAVQKIEGNVTVEGIAGLEKLLQNAETYEKIGDTKRENETLNRVTQEYPEDWRGWWRLFLMFSDHMNPKLLHACYSSNYKPYTYSEESIEQEIQRRKYESEKLIEHTLSHYANAAVKVAPEDKRVELSSQLTAYLQQLRIQEKNLQESLRNSMKAHLEKSLEKMRMEGEQREAQEKANKQEKKKRDRLAAVGGFFRYIVTIFTLILAIAGIVNNLHSWPLLFFPLGSFILGIYLQNKYD